MCNFDHLAGAAPVVKQPVLPASVWPAIFRRHAKAVQRNLRLMARNIAKMKRTPHA